jgi:hypothetical protein
VESIPKSELQFKCQKLVNRSRTRNSVRKLVRLTHGHRRQCGTGKAIVIDVCES